MILRVALAWLMSAIIGLTASPAGADPVLGAWSPQILNMKVDVIHAHLLPTTGEVLFWPTYDAPHLWRPETDGAGLYPDATPVAKTGYNIFCSGHCLLPDGRLFVTGGHRRNNVGLPNATIYQPSTGTWTRTPNMNAGRWYPTNAALASGDVVVVSGDIRPGKVNTLPQVFQVVLGNWRNLSAAQLAQPLYPWMHLTGDGRVFSSGPSEITRYLDTSGSGQWTAVAPRPLDADGKGGFRDYGSSVMYDDDKVLVLGGGDPATNTALVIDLRAPTPTWTFTGSMASARRQLNATLLPDGNVLVTGGTSGPGFNNKGFPVKAAELWNPGTGQWTTLASEAKGRFYHSTALLLPDGRVLSAGSDGEPNGQVYWPPYLFWGARPTIQAAPVSVSYDQPFTVQTPDAGVITRVTWLRLPSVTHAFNQDQRINRLTIESTVHDPATGQPVGLSVRAPSSANAAPPGYYMLFILRDEPNRGLVPSEAKIIRLG